MEIQNVSKPDMEESELVSFTNVSVLCMVDKENKVKLLF